MLYKENNCYRSVLYGEMPLHDCSGQRETAFFLLFCFTEIDFFVIISLPDGLRSESYDHSDEDG